ncbi:MAG: ABC transporter ATP-binding protein [Candidatus Latescibacterota bacterium]
MSDWAIRTRDLCRSFGSTVAVDHLDLEVPRGSVFGFIGRNGAGKTTTIRMLLDLLRPDAGSVEVLGMDPRRQAVQIKRRVGYVPETPQLYGWMRVGEMTRFTGRYYRTWNPERVDELLRRFGLRPETRVRHLSGGMAAQLALVLALGHDPELLILDEPSTGLDVLVRRDFLASIVQVIQEEGRTVLFSSHLVHEVERVADRVAIIEGGRLLACAPTGKLKARTRKVLVRSAGDTGALEAIPGVAAVEGQGSTRLVTVTDYSPGTAAALAAAGAQVVEVVDMGLEESFIALVRPHARERSL